MRINDLTLRHEVNSLVAKTLNGSSIYFYSRYDEPLGKIDIPSKCFRQNGPRTQYRNTSKLALEFRLPKGTYELYTYKVYRVVNGRRRVMLEGYCSHLFGQSWAVEDGDTLIIDKDNWTLDLGDFNAEEN